MIKSTLAIVILILVECVQAQAPFKSELTGNVYRYNLDMNECKITSLGVQYHFWTELGQPFMKFYVNWQTDGNDPSCLPGKSALFLFNCSTQGGTTLIMDGGYGGYIPAAGAGWGYDLPGSPQYNHLFIISYPYQSDYRNPNSVLAAYTSGQFQYMNADEAMQFWAAGFTIDGIDVIVPQNNNPATITPGNNSNSEIQNNNLNSNTNSSTNNLSNQPTSQLNNLSNSYNQQLQTQQGQEAQRQAIEAQQREQEAQENKDELERKIQAIKDAAQQRIDVQSNNINNINNAVQQGLQNLSNELDKEEASREANRELNEAKEEAKEAQEERDRKIEEEEEKAADERREAREEQRREDAKREEERVEQARLMEQWKDDQIAGVYATNKFKTTAAVWENVNKIYYAGWIRKPNTNVVYLIPNLQVAKYSDNTWPLFVMFTSKLVAALVAKGLTPAGTHLYGYFTSPYEAAKLVKDVITNANRIGMSVQMLFINLKGPDAGITNSDFWGDSNLKDSQGNLQIQPNSKDSQSVITNKDIWGDTYTKKLNDSITKKDLQNNSAATGSKSTEPDKDFWGESYSNSTGVKDTATSKHLQNQSNSSRNASTEKAFQNKSSSTASKSTVPGGDIWGDCYTKSSKDSTAKRTLQNKTSTTSAKDTTTDKDFWNK